MFYPSLLALPTGWNEDWVVSLDHKIRVTPKVRQAGYAWIVMGEINYFVSTTTLLGLHSRQSNM